MNIATSMRPFYNRLGSALATVEVEDDGYTRVKSYLQMCKDTAGPNGARLIFIGNGGSAAIASHMAADYQKNGGFPTLCFNDPASLTCISNDIGYGSVFRHPLEKHARFGDVLIAISSSGNSVNIINAVDYAVDSHLNVVTLSGFSPDNRLRTLGGANFYVPSANYGIIEIAHLTILHGLLDEAMNGNN